MSSLKKFLYAGLVAFLVVVGLALSPASVRAVAILDFNMDAIHPLTASVSYAGGATPLVGKDISVDSVTGIGTPLNSGVTLPFEGILNFTTGNFTGSDASHWNFGGGGSIEVKAGLTTVLAGFFESAQVLQVGGDFKIVGASFFDRKLEELLLFYGLPIDVIYTGNMNLSFLASGLPPGAFTSTAVLSGDLINGKIPEPISLILLGSGLAGAGLYRRLRKPKS